MDNRTAEIIMICKGNHNYGENLTYKEAITAYVSERCGTPVEYLTESDINDIIFEAALDFLDGADKPSVLLRDAIEAYNRSRNPLFSVTKQIDIYDALCFAFRHINVKATNSEGVCYINGFTEENTQPVLKTEL